MFYWAQVIAGILIPILKQRKDNLQCINSIWTMNFINFLQKYKIEVKLQDLNKLTST